MSDCRRVVEICNRQGLHARPCHAVVSLAGAFAGDVRVTCREREVNAKSILELMTLNAPVGSVLEFQASGEGAEELLDQLEALVTGGFGELEHP